MSHYKCQICGDETIGITVLSNVMRAALCMDCANGWDQFFSQTKIYRELMLHEFKRSVVLSGTPDANSLESLADELILLQDRIRKLARSWLITAPRSEQSNGSTVLVRGTKGSRDIGYGANRFADMSRRLENERENTGSIAMHAVYDDVLSILEAIMEIA